MSETAQYFISFDDFDGQSVSDLAAGAGDIDLVGYEFDLTRELTGSPASGVRQGSEFDFELTVDFLIGGAFGPSNFDFLETQIAESKGFLGDFKLYTMDLINGDDKADFQKVRDIEVINARVTNLSFDGVSTASVGLVFDDINVNDFKIDFSTGEGAGSEPNNFKASESAKGELVVTTSEFPGLNASIDLSEGALTGYISWKGLDTNITLAGNSDVIVLSDISLDELTLFQSDGKGTADDFGTIDLSIDMSNSAVAREIYDVLFPDDATQPEALSDLKIGILQAGAGPEPVEVLTLDFSGKDGTAEATLLGGDLGPSFLGDFVIDASELSITATSLDEKGKDTVYFEGDFERQDTGIEVSGSSDAPVLEGLQAIARFDQIDVNPGDTPIDAAFFGLENFSVGATTASIGPGTGKQMTTMENLVIDLRPFTVTTNELLDAYITQSVIASGDIQLYANNGTQIVREYDFSNLRVASFSEHSGFATQVELTYEDVTIESTIFDDKGGVQGTDTLFFETEATGSKLGTVSTNRAMADTVFDTDALDYFLVVEGIAGGTTDKAYADENAFNVAGFELGWANITQGVMGVSDITIALGEGDLNNDVFFEALARGASVPSLRLDVVQPTGVSRAVIQSYSMSDAVLSSFMKREGRLDEVSFDFSTISIETAPVNVDGSVGQELSTGILNAVDMAPVSDLGVGVSLELSASFSLDTFVLIGDGKEIIGSSVDPDRPNENWFDVDGYAFGVEVETTKNGSGVADNKAGFDPSHSTLTLELEAGQSGVAGLIAAAATGEVFEEIQIVDVLDGRVASGDQLSVSRTFTDVKVLALEESDDGPALVTLGYDAYSVTAVDSNGDEVIAPLAHDFADSTGKSDASQNGILNSISTYSLDVLTDPSDISFDIYATISDLKGSVQAAGFENTIAVNSYNFDLFALTQVQSETATVASAPITLTLDFGNAGALKLLGLTKDGKQMPEAKLEFVTNLGDGLQPVIKTITLSNVTVQEFTQDTLNPNIAYVSLGYSRLSIDVKDITSTGELEAAPYVVDFAVNDEIFGGVGNDTADGGLGDDTINTGAGDDLVLGGEGADRLIGGSGEGNDTYDGGEGIDTLVYTSADLGIFVDLTADKNQAFGEEIDTDQITGVENFLLGDGDDTITLDGEGNFVESGLGHDMIDGVSGRDRLLGGAGNDTIRSGGDSDTLNGGDGNDDIDSGGGRDVVTLGRGRDVFVDAVEGNFGGSDTVFAGNGNDTIIGNGGDDVYYGGNGFDSIVGGDGNDLIFGNKNRDTILSGAGNDTVDSGLGNDFVSLGDGQDVYNGASSTGRDTVNGGAGHDVIIANDGDQFLLGGGGFDYIEGGNGADQIIGGGQNDTILGGAGRDTILGGFGSDLIDLGVGFDVYIDSGNALGNDTITGGVGIDTFVFGPGIGADVITDYRKGADELNFDDLLWTGTLTAKQVVDTFAEVTEDGILFTFDENNSVLLADRTSLSSLAFDLTIF
ncbi:type VI secretion system tube protein Hcp [Roseobacteraceae bacterium S113]